MEVRKSGKAIRCGRCIEVNYCDMGSDLYVAFVVCVDCVWCFIYIYIYMYDMLCVALNTHKPIKFAHINICVSAFLYLKAMNAG